MPSLLPHASFWRGRHTDLPAPTKIIPFAGRIGANQEFSIDKNSSAQKELLQKLPDAAPWVPLRDALSPKSFLHIELWKGAVAEAIGQLPLALDSHQTIFCSYMQTADWSKLRNMSVGIPDLLHSRWTRPVGKVGYTPWSRRPPNMPNIPSTFASGALVPSLLGGAISMFTLPLFIFATGPVSGAHLNPTITIATFFGRLATLPRCILYVAFQTFGGAIAGWLLRASFDTRSVGFFTASPSPGRFGCIT